MGLIEVDSPLQRASSLCPGRRPLLLSSWYSPQDHPQVLTKEAKAPGGRWDSAGQALEAVLFFSPTVSEPQPVVHEGTFM